MDSWNDTIGQTIDLIQDGKDIFSNQYVILALTFAAFFYVRRLQQRTGWMLLNPILIAIILLIIYLKVTGVPFEVYKQDAQLIDFWLKPAVVALGVPLYLQLDAIKRLWLPIVLSACRLLGRYRECRFGCAILSCSEVHHTVFGK